MESGIYTIINLINGKILVGQSKNVKSRLHAHKNRLRTGIHENSHLQKAFNKYGESAFEFKLLENVERDYLFMMELYWSNLLDAHNESKGYNIKACGPNGYGKHSQATKDKIGKANKGQVRSDAVRF